jgi:hypothetical protein
VVGRAPGRTLDVVADDEDDGAVPKNLVIPRPEKAAPRRAPTPPQARNADASPSLADFRNLLQKAGRP